MCFLPVHDNYLLNKQTVAAKCMGPEKKPGGILMEMGMQRRGLNSTKVTKHLTSGNLGIPWNTPRVSTE